MNPMRKFSAGVCAVMLVIGLSGCSGMTARDKSTAIGAGVGALGGAALTEGSALGTIGGAAVGGIVGNQIGKDKR
jgi:osmotically inducible lipoprotein OsmB